MIDQLGIGPGDAVLQVGAGEKAYHSIACAVRGAKVDIVQPDYWIEEDKTNNISQHDYLVESIKHRRGYSIDAFGKDLIGDRIDTENYRGYIQDVNIPTNRYSYVFLLNILDSVVAELHRQTVINSGNSKFLMAFMAMRLQQSISDVEIIKKRVIEVVLSSCKDNVTVLLSTKPGRVTYLQKETRFFKNHAEKLGYTVEEGRVFNTEFNDIVEELIVTRNREETHTLLKGYDFQKQRVLSGYI